MFFRSVNVLSICRIQAKACVRTLVKCWGSCQFIARTSSDKASALPGHKLISVLHSYERWEHISPFVKNRNHFIFKEEIKLIFPLSNKLMKNCLCCHWIAGLLGAGIAGKHIEGWWRPEDSEVSEQCSPIEIKQFSQFSQHWF